MRELDGVPRAPGGLPAGGAGGAGGRRRAARGRARRAHMRSPRADIAGIINEGGDPPRAAGRKRDAPMTPGRRPVDKCGRPLENRRRPATMARGAGAGRRGRPGPPRRARRPEDERDDDPDTGDAGGGRPRREAGPPRRLRRGQPREAARDLPRPGWRSSATTSTRPSGRTRGVDHRHGGDRDRVGRRRLVVAQRRAPLRARGPGSRSAEFRRVLKPGGFALITLPDLQKVAELVAADGSRTSPTSRPPARSARSTCSTAGAARSPRATCSWPTTPASPRRPWARRLATARAGFAPVAVSRSGFDLWASKP